jgi:hypothetical protein
VKFEQIGNAPKWANDTRYDLVATTGAEVQAPISHVRIMLQRLLQDRFELKLHRDAKVIPVYELTIGKNGTKLKAVEVDAKPPGAPLGFLLMFISSFLDRPLVDKTGLTAERYQFDWNPPPELKEELAQGKPAPSIFGVVQLQLGLKLDARNSSTEFLVVEHVERPSEN